MFGRSKIVTCSLLTIILAAGCGQNASADEPTKGVDQSRRGEQAISDPALAAAFARQADAVADAYNRIPDPDLQFYPLSNYARFPVEVRELIRRHDVENDRCRSRGDEPETLIGCNRRHYLTVELERLGWCWGGSNTSAEQRWLKCADDPGYVPGQAGKAIPFSAAYIEKVAIAAKAQDRDSGTPKVKTDTAL